MDRAWTNYTSIFLVALGVTFGCTAAPPCQDPSTLPMPSSSPVLSNSALQQKVKAQEKRISELSTQLNLLKRIDQDQQKQR